MVVVNIVVIAGFIGRGLVVVFRDTAVFINFVVTLVTNAVIIVVAVVVAVSGCLAITLHVLFIGSFNTFAIFSFSFIIIITIILSIIITTTDSISITVSLVTISKVVLLVAIFFFKIGNVFVFFVCGDVIACVLLAVVALLRLLELSLLFVLCERVGLRQYECGEGRVAW